MSNLSYSSYDSYYYGENTTNNNNGNLTYDDDDDSSHLQLLFSFPLQFEIFVYLIYNIVFVLAVGGNLLVFWVVVSSVRMRTVTNYLIANLALGDLLMALLTVPFSYISILKQYWPFGLVLCHVVSPAQAVCVFVSAYTLIALAIDRYMAILYPLRPRLRKSQTLVVVAVVWIVAVFTAAPIAIFTRLEPEPITGLPLCDEFAWPSKDLKMVYGLALLTLQYFFPITVLIYTYSRIVLEIWWKKRPMDDGEITRVFEESREHRLSKARRKTVVMTLSVVVGYTLAWLPQNISLLYSQTLLAAEETATIEEREDEESVIYPYIFFICHWPAMAHTMYNPLIYAWVNSKFRDAFANVFRCRKKKVNIFSTSRTAAAANNSFAANVRNRRRGILAVGASVDSENNTPPLVQFQRDHHNNKQQHDSCSSAEVINGEGRTGCADNNGGGGGGINNRKTVELPLLPPLPGHIIIMATKVGVAEDKVDGGVEEDVSCRSSSSSNNNYNNNSSTRLPGSSMNEDTLVGESSLLDRTTTTIKVISTEKDKKSGDCCWSEDEDSLNDQV